MRRRRQRGGDQGRGLRGGRGAAVRRALRAAGPATGTSPACAETERRLRAAGFTDVWCWRTRVEVDPGDRAGYLRAICLGSFLERLPEELREPFLAAALDRLPDPLVIHYVRLNILARRPA